MMGATLFPSFSHSSVIQWQLCKPGMLEGIPIRRPNPNLQPNQNQPLGNFWTGLAEWNWKFSNDEICWFITWDMPQVFWRKMMSFMYILSLWNRPWHAPRKYLNAPNRLDQMRTKHSSIYESTCSCGVIFFPNHLNQDTSELVGLSSTKSGGSTKDRDPPTKFMRFEIIAFHMQNRSQVKLTCNKHQVCFKHKDCFWDWCIHMFT